MRSPVHGSHGRRVRSGANHEHDLVIAANNRVLVLVADSAKSRSKPIVGGIPYAAAGDSMVPGVTRILRLAFVPDRPIAEDASLETPDEAPLIEFVAFTDDCALAGLIRLSAERLTDLLNDADEIELLDVVIKSVRTGHDLAYRGRSSSPSKRSRPAATPLAAARPASTRSRSAQAATFCTGTSTPVRAPIHSWMLAGGHPSFR